MREQHPEKKPILSEYINPIDELVEGSIKKEGYLLEDVLPEDEKIVIENALRYPLKGETYNMVYSRGLQTEGCGSSTGYPRTEICTCSFNYSKARARSREAVLGCGPNRHKP